MHNFISSFASSLSQEDHKKSYHEEDGHKKKHHDEGLISFN